MLTADEVERYSRHLVLPEIGGPGQQRLRQASLLVVGAGGLGTPVLQYCAAAGVGRIGVVDHDRVALSNLHRQVLYGMDDIGAPKAERAALAIRRLNPHVAVEAFTVRLSARNAGSIVGSYDIIADCTDTFATRCLVSDACFHTMKTLVTAAVIGLDGHVTTLKPHLRGPGGRPNPTYRCLFPQPPEEDAGACAEHGVLGVLPGLVGAIQATEIVKELAGSGASLVGRLLLVDGRDLRFESIAYEWDPGNPLNGTLAEPIAG